MIPFAISLPSGGEWLVILLIVFVLFGAGRLPQVFESFGKAVKNFRDAQKDEAVDVTPGAPKEIPESEVAASEAQEVRERAGRT